jgi:hypothetical protein
MENQKMENQKMEKEIQKHTDYCFVYCVAIYAGYNLFWKFLDIYEKKYEYDSKNIDNIEKRIKKLEQNKTEIL